MLSYTTDICMPGVSTVDTNCLHVVSSSVVRNGDDTKQQIISIDVTSCYNLTWTDYKGNVPIGVDYDVESFVGSTTTWNRQLVSSKIKDGQHSTIATIIKGTVTIVFDCSKSWLKSGGINNVDILSYEQGHFDIATCFGRKKHAALTKAITNKTSAIGKGTTQRQAENVAEVNLDIVINDILKIIDGAESVTQLRYDRNTAHGTNVGQQAIWKKVVASCNGGAWSIYS
jgi:hypothetical protein